MKIEELPSGSYRVRKMYKGVSYPVTFDHKPTQKEAMQALVALMEKSEKQNQDTDENDDTDLNKSFKEAAEEYIENKINVLSQTTVKEYMGKNERLADAFTRMHLSDITAKDVQKEINRLAKKLSPKTVCDYHGFITAVLGYFRPELVLKTTLPQKIKPNAYIPTDDDVHKLLEYAKGTMFEIAITLGCYGMRRSEICALTLHDIQGNYIIINKALVMDKDKNWVLKATKTEDSTRTIWVPDEVIELIKQYGKIYDGFPGSISKYMRSAQDALGIPHFSLHKLRHYYASSAHALGVPDNYIMDACGWKTPAVFTSIYRHAMSDKKNEMQHFTAEYLKEVMFH